MTVSFGLLQREVVDSILQGNANKYTFDAKDVVFQVGIIWPLTTPPPHFPSSFPFFLSPSPLPPSSFLLPSFPPPHHKEANNLDKVNMCLFVCLFVIQIPDLVLQEYEALMREV